MSSSTVGCVSGEARETDAKGTLKSTLADLNGNDPRSTHDAYEGSNASSTDRMSSTIAAKETPYKATSVTDTHQEDMHTPLAAATSKNTDNTPTPLSHTQSHAAFGQHPHHNQFIHHQHHRHHPQCLAHTPGTRKAPPMLPPNLHSMLYHGLITPTDAAAAMIALEASGKKKNRSAKATPCREGTSSLSAAFTPDASFQVTSTTTTTTAAHVDTTANLMVTPHARGHRKDTSSSKKIIPYAMKPSSVAAGFAGNMNMQTPDQFSSLHSPLVTAPSGLPQQASPHMQNSAGLPTGAVHVGHGGAIRAPENGNSGAPRFGLPHHHVMVSQPRALDFSPFSDSTGSIGPACLSPATGGGHTVDKKVAAALQSASRGDSRFTIQRNAIHPSGAPIDGSTCRPLYPNDFLESPSYRPSALSSVPHSASRSAQRGMLVQPQVGSTLSPDFSVQGRGKDSTPSTAMGGGGQSNCTVDRQLQKQLLTAGKEELVQMLLDLSSNHQDAAKLIQDKLYLQPSASEHVVAHIREQPSNRFSVLGLASSVPSRAQPTTRPSDNLEMFAPVNYYEDGNTSKQEERVSAPWRNECGPKVETALRSQSNEDARAAVRTPHAENGGVDDDRSPEESPMENPTPRKPLFATPTCDHTFRVTSTSSSSGHDGVLRHDSKTPMRDTLFGMHSKNATENPRLAHPSALRMTASYVAPPASYALGKLKTPVRTTDDAPLQQAVCDGPEGRDFATEVHPCLLWYKGCRNSRSCIFSQSPRNLCLNWVRGSCPAGSECTGVHRLPSPCPQAIQTLFDLSRDASRTGMAAQLPAVQSLSSSMSVPSVLSATVSGNNLSSGVPNGANGKMPSAEFSAVKTPNSQLIREFPSRGVISSNEMDVYCEDEVDLAAALAGVPVRRNLENSFRRTVPDSDEEEPESDDNAQAQKETSVRQTPSSASSSVDVHSTGDVSANRDDCASTSEKENDTAACTRSDSPSDPTVATDQAESSSTDHLDRLPATRAMTPENNQLETPTSE